MYIFRKKRFALLLCFLCMSFTFSFLANKPDKAHVNNRNYDITQVSSIPATGKVVVIDAGHRSERIGRRC